MIISQMIVAKLIENLVELFLNMNGLRYLDPLICVDA
jgi:hypothetical protein